MSKNVFYCGQRVRAVQGCKFSDDPNDEITFGQVYVVSGVAENTHLDTKIVRLNLEGKSKFINSSFFIPTFSSIRLLGRSSYAGARS